MGSSDIQSLVASIALAQGINPVLALAVARQESGFNPSAVSKAGAIGVMQLMPATAAQLGVDPTDPAQNIQGGVAYLKQQISQFSDPAQALAAYNWGAARVQAAVAQYGPDWLSHAPAETQNYVSSILGSTATAGNIEIAVPVDLAGTLGISSTGTNRLLYLAAIAAALGVGLWALSEDD